MLVSDHFSLHSDLPEKNGSVEASLQNQTVTPHLVLNFSLLDQVYAGDECHIRDLFEAFLQEEPATFAALKKAMENNDWISFTRLAHKIKPDYAYVGLDIFEKKLETMERFARTAPGSPELNTLFEAFEALRPAGIKAVEHYLASLSNS